MNWKLGDSRPWFLVISLRLSDRVLQWPFFSLYPIPIELSTILISEHPWSMLDSLFVSSNILTLIRPYKLSLTIHLKINPISFIDTPIRPVIHPKALNSIFKKLSLVKLIFAPRELSPSAFLALFILPYITSAIIPKLFSQVILDIIEPISF